MYSSCWLRFSRPVFWDCEREEVRVSERVEEEERETLQREWEERAKKALVSMENAEMGDIVKIVRRCEMEAWVSQSHMSTFEKI